MPFERLKKRFSGRKKAELPLASAADLEPIRARRFPIVPPDRFTKLWTAIANICGVGPLNLHEDDQVSLLCPSKGVLDLNLKIMELEALVAAESKHRPPPATRLQTIGDIVDYLTGE